MTIANDIEELQKKVKELEAKPEKKSKEPKPFKFKITIPGGVARKARKEGVFAVLLLSADKEAVFTNGYYNDGLIVVGRKSFAYEKATVFWHKKRKIPLIVLYEWRLTPLSGDTDAVKQGVGVVREKEDHEFAEEANLTNYGQQTIIRAITQAQLPDLAKKFGAGSALWWIIGGVVVLYLISEMMKGI